MSSLRLTVGDLRTPADALVRFLFAFLSTCAVTQLQAEKRDLFRRLPCSYINSIENKVPGMIVHITDLLAESDDEGVTYAYGVRSCESQVPMRKNELFPLGSLAKNFTTVLLIEEMEAHKVAFTTRVADIFSYPIDPHFKDITIETLLTHRAGLVGESTPPNALGFAGSNRDQLSKYLLQHPPLYAVGEAGYSSYGFTILGSVIEELEGRSWEEVLFDRVIKPLGLASCRFPSAKNRVYKNTLPLIGDEQYPALMKGYEVRQQNWRSIPPSEFLDPMLNPGAGLYCNMQDLAKFIAFEARGIMRLPEHSPAAISVFSSNESFKKLFEVPRGQVDKNSYGDWSLFGYNGGDGAFKRACTYGATAGITVVACFDPTNQLVAIAMGNVWGPEIDYAIEESVARSLNGPD